MPHYVPTNGNQPANCSKEDNTELLQFRSYLTPCSIRKKNSLKKAFSITSPKIKRSKDINNNQRSQSLKDISRQNSLDKRRKPQNNEISTSTPGAWKSHRQLYYRISLRLEKLGDPAYFDAKLDDVFEDSAGTHTLKEKRMLSYSLDEPVSFGIAAKKIAQQELKVNSLRKVNSYKESLSKKEIKDLNSLLTAFDLEKVDCSSESDEEQKINKQKKDLNDNQSVGTASKKNNPDDLNDVVNELLSVGSSNTLTNYEQGEHNKKNTLTKRSIENFFGNSNLFPDIQVVLSENSSSNSSTCSCCCSDNDIINHVIYEINDSGIDDTMPGIVKEPRDESSKRRDKHHKKSHDGHRRKKHSKHRKHHNDYNNKDTLTRSHSEEPRKYRDIDEPDSIHSHSSKRRDKNGDKCEREGRSRGRRSEPLPLLTKPPIDNKRRLESIVTNKVRNENDIEGGAVGVYKRTNSNLMDYSTKNYGGKVVIPVVKEKKTEVVFNGKNLQRNKSDLISPKSNEYFCDSDDGKHRVYVRSKETNNIHTSEKSTGHQYSRKSASPDNELVDKLGISPEILDLLKEEEKFWQKQQDLKKWRESRGPLDYRFKDKQSRGPVDYRAKDKESVYDKAYSDRSNVINKTNSKPYQRELREIEEDELERHAELLMRVRAEQQHVLKTSRENLLKEDRPNDTRDYYPREPYSRDVYSLSQESRSSGYFSSRDHSNHTRTRHHNENRQMRSYNSSGTTSPRETTETSSYLSSSPLSPTFEGNRQINGHSSPGSPKTRLNSQSSYLLRSGCFSDDDEVFSNQRKLKENSQTNEDHKGYFSDYDSHSLGRTFNARPLIQQRKAKLRCTACYRIVSDERLMCVEGHNFYWHLKCFFCVVCKAFLNDKHAIRIRMVNYKLHCRYCYSQNGELLSEV